MGYNWVVKWFIAIGQYFNTWEHLRWEFGQKFKHQVIVSILSKMDPIEETVREQNREDFDHSMGCLHEYQGKYNRLKNVEFITFEEFKTLGPDTSDDDSAFECEM